MSKTILAIDDSPSVLQMVSLTLSSAGFRVVEAVDGADGYAKAVAKTIDPVVTDLNMPRMDGLTLLRKLRKGERTRTLPVVVISSMGNDHLDQELRDLAVTAIIRKPLTPAKIRDAFPNDEGGF